jgi:integrase
MARTLRDPRLDSRTSRRSLTQAHDPYWKSIDGGMHVGYRKGKHKASWLARYRGDDGRYHKVVLGVADDIQDADGLNILSFSQAQAKAREWFTKMAHHEAGFVDARRGRYTVARMMEDYLDWYAVHRRGIGQVRSVYNAHIKPELGHLEVEKLTHVRIRAFHERLALAPPKRRTKPGKQQNFGSLPESEDEIRRRKASANRVLTVLKAALNRAYIESKISSDEPWRRVAPFRAVDAPRVRYLTLEECTRLVAACPDDFKKLVKAALFTGCRYGELARLVVRDFIADQGKLYVQASKNGKERFVTLSDEAQTFFKAVTKGRNDSELLFQHDDGSAWKKAHQTRRLSEVCITAKIEPAVSFHILRHTHASHLSMNRTPLPVIAAQLGHSDTRMVEKHYAHLAPSYVSDAIRDGMPVFKI